MIISLAFPVRAANQAADNDMIASLLNRGYPADFLQRLVPPKLENLYNLANERDLYYLQIF